MISDNQQRWLETLADAAGERDLARDAARQWHQRLAALNVDGTATVRSVIQALAAHPLDDFLTAMVLDRVALAWTDSGDPSCLDDQAIDQIMARFGQSAAGSPVRMGLLRLLAIDGSARALRELAELLATSPALGEQAFLMVLVPLMQRRGKRPWAAEALFPRLFDAAAHYPHGAPAIFDLANLAFRGNLVVPHPAASQGERLIALFGQAVNHLAQIEEHPERYQSAPQTLYQSVAQGVALVITLCDTLALTGRLEAAPKLHQASQLAHRRIRTEAAAALARLGDDDGIEMLAGLAREPVARLRALSYLGELSTPENSLLERVEPQFRTDEARAEGELAAWLAEPTQYGVAPNRLELVDRCRQYWPGYEQPVDCFLFRFEYRMGAAAIASVGIAGPIVHALAADLQDLPPADIYALYAGWHAEHPEIVPHPVDDLTLAQQQHWEIARRQLAEQGYESAELFRVADFFGERHLVATAHLRGQPGVLVAAGGNLHWYPLQTNRRRALGPEELYQLHKGRLLLRAFNRQQ